MTGSPRAENFAASLLPNGSVSLKLHSKFVYVVLILLLC